VSNDADADGDNLIRTVRARDAERGGRILPLASTGGRTRADEKDRAETSRRCAVGTARRLVARGWEAKLADALGRGYERL